MTTPTRSGLVVTVPSEREVIMTRTFAAPRQLVFDAWTEPEHLVHWYGREGWKLVVCEIDLRPGGTWRFLSEGTDGATLGHIGVYREVVRPERLLFTEAFEGAAFEQMGGETLGSLVLEERDGATVMTRTIRYSSNRHRDAALRTPMAEGTESAFKRLDRHLAAIAVSERYRRLAAAFADKISGVPADAWDAPTPCAAWNVAELVRHVVEMNEVHIRLAGRPAPAGPSVDDDPLGAFNHVRRLVDNELADPERALAEVENRFGRWTFAEIVDRAVCVDLAVHGWDLARATRQDERISPTDLPHLRELVKSTPDNVLRSPIAYGAALVPPPDADEQTRLLAYLGREA